MLLIAYEHTGEGIFKEKDSKETKKRMRCWKEAALGLVELNTPMRHPGWDGCLVRHGYHEVLEF